MPRTSNVPSPSMAGATPDTSVVKSVFVSRPTPDSVGTFWDMLAFRLIFAFVCTGAAYHFKPFGLSKSSMTTCVPDATVIGTANRLRCDFSKELVSSASKASPQG